MKVRLHPQARAEFLASMIHYEAARPGLGNRFITAVAKAMKNVQLFPESFPIFEDEIACNFRRGHCVKSDYSTLRSRS